MQTATASTSRLILLPTAVFVFGIAYWALATNFRVNANPITSIFYIVSGVCGVIVGLYMNRHFRGLNEVPMHYVCIVLGVWLAMSGLYKLIF